MREKHKHTYTRQRGKRKEKKNGIFVVFRLILKNICSCFYLLFVFRFGFYYLFVFENTLGRMVKITLSHWTQLNYDYSCYKEYYFYSYVYNCCVVFFFVLPLLLLLFFFVVAGGGGVDVAVVCEPFRALIWRLI